MAEFTPDAVLRRHRAGGRDALLRRAGGAADAGQPPALRETDFSRLKYIFYGAAPIPLELLRQCVKAFGCQFPRPTA
jgi:acyl-CoA synthetase (AMP-forming)/AMP-acid ligase II